MSHESFFKPRINVASFFSTVPQRPGLLDPFISFNDFWIQCVGPLWILSSIIIQTVMCIFTNFFNLTAAFILHLRQNHRQANEHLLQCVSDTSLVLIKLPFVTTCDSILATIAIFSRIISSITIHGKNKILQCVYGELPQSEKHNGKPILI
jgi:hypothetical protein